MTWSVPAQPNGIIVSYEILRQIDGVSSSLAIVFRTNDTLSRAYTDTSVLPASVYQYAIRAVNSVGQTESDFAAVSTPEAAPEGVQAPSLAVLSSSSLSLSWTPPSQQNGVITQYQAFRRAGSATNASVYIGQNPSFVDTGLEAFTRYFYVIQACTAGGCAVGPEASAVTLEDIPADFAAPVALPLTQSAISVSWSEPDTPNGIITTYIVTISPIGIQIQTTELEQNVSNLRAFTNYSVQVQACTSVGCVASQTDVQTLEAVPELISAPTLVALNATAVQVSWREPAIPNGVILRYDLRRNGTLVLSAGGSTPLSYTDAELSPNQFYSYTVQAFTSAGAGEESSGTVVQTAPDTPEGILPPALTPLSSTAIAVLWAAPSSPNGVIQQYILYQDGVVVFQGLAFSFTVQDLTPFTSYSFQLSVCTTTCGDSAVVSAQTLEAAPLGQAPPSLVANGNTTVSVSWEPPSTPNGIVTRYEVERRSSGGSFVVVFSGPVRQFLDADSLLRPAMAYDYRVTASNGASSVTSAPASVTLQDAAPEAVLPPRIENVEATSLVAILQPPAVPNGVLTLYRVYQNGAVVNETVPSSQSDVIVVQLSTGLLPFTQYVFFIEICTSGGCGRSDVVTVTTAEAPPSGFDSPPLADVQSPREISISWIPPARPNGMITSYTVRYSESCPQPPQPNLDLPACVLGPCASITIDDGLPGSQRSLLFNGSLLSAPIPYSSYQFQVEAFNSAGSATSPCTGPVQNPPSAPEPLQELFRFSLDQENQCVSLDWSKAFLLNGQLLHFIVSRNGSPLLQQPITQAKLANEPVGIPLEYVITAVTREGSVSLQPVVLMLEGAPPGTTVEPPSVTAPTTLPPPDRLFYQEAAFIIGIIVLGVAILFVIGAVSLCCLRPRGSSYKVRETLPPEEPTTPTKNITPTRVGGYSRMRMPTSDSWSPGEKNSWGEGDIPDLGSELEGPVYTPDMRSYSPKKSDTSGLLENEHRLSDIKISSQASQQYPLRQLATASDDFDSYRASRTTFADTKV